ncbi:MurR/RpiR family transcriptional regulator [Pseudactinotalea terrae]|uniref:MurR/RpiR family transcriptional regulator n=1 Tax=Pseudactinotalea terrae TaxID=1743262 RepID=UPI0012E0EF0E|nr:MurR/RpiR family transcriptional regulator [Pseudactinotalea terrae]
MASTPSLRSTGILTDLRRLLPELPASVRKVAEVVLADPQGAVAGTLHDLADAGGSSPSAVSRLCRRLGIDGYPALRVAVAADAASAGSSPWELDISRTISPTDPLDKVARTLATVQTLAVRDTLSGLDLDAVRQVAEAIATAGRVQLYAVSGSAVMTSELELRLSRIGVPTWSFTDVHDGLVGACLLGESDVAIAVSYTGETTETVEMLRAARQAGAVTAAITGSPRSPLAEVAAHTLITVSDATTFGQGPLAGRFAELAVVEMLYLAVSQLTYDRASALLTLTAGAVKAHQMSHDRRPRR